MTVKLVGSTSGSVSLQAPASTSGGAHRVLTLPDANATLATTSDSFGKILQVKQTAKTDQFTSTAYAFTDVTGMSVSITPASTSNKILIKVEILVGGTANNYAAFRLLRDSTHIGVSTVTDTDWRVATTGSLSHENSYQLENTGTSFLDSPNTTSAITYKLQVSSYSNRTMSLNYPWNTGNSSGSYTATGISTITVMEVAA